MKVFVIENRLGFVCLPEKIASFSFPLTFGSLNGATQFPFKSAANKVIKKYHLKNAHIEEFEFDDLNN